MAAVKGLAPLVLLILVWRGSAFASTNELRFLIIGDWGGNETTPYTTPVETAVSREMGKLAEIEGTRFTVALGDNFYHYGVKNIDDRRFKETFEDVFTAQSLMTPWYVCAGNHDHYGNVSAQVAYSLQSSRWKFPSYYYTKSWKISGSDKELQLILLDTVILCGYPGLDKYHLQPEGPESVKQAEDQWRWVESILRSSKAHYLVVGGLFPVWSIAEHGPTWCLVKRLRPLLQRYNVTAYISGHDHNLQHLKEDNSSVEYFVIGAGAYVEYSTKHKGDVPEGSSRFFWADVSHQGGFAVVRTGVEEMTLGFVDSCGNTIYSTKRLPRK